MVKGLSTIDEVQADGTIEGDYRINYLRDHIEEMQKAIELNGLELMGFIPWWYNDIVSSGTGDMRKHYGFNYVDRDDKVKKPSNL